MKKIKKKLNLKVMVIVYASFIGVAGQVHGSGSYTTLDLNEQVVMATLWIQTSAEFRTLCYQSFNWPE